MARPLDHWRDEKRSAELYRVLAEAEKGTPREALFADLARAAEAQGAIWAQSASRGGEGLPAFAPGPRVRIAALLIRRFGPRRIRPLLAALKVRGLSVLREPGLIPPASPRRAVRSRRWPVSPPERPRRSGHPPGERCRP